MPDATETSESKVSSILRNRPQWSVDGSGRFYITPTGRSGALRAGWTFKPALRAYLAADKSHRWGDDGRCTRCGVQLDGDHATLKCAHPSTTALDPTKEVVACPLVAVLTSYLDAAICRARFAKKRGVWPVAGEELLVWDKMMPDDPLDRL